MTLTTSDIEELRSRLGGNLHQPGEPAYEETCSLFNAMITKRPALVARCSAPLDLVTVIAFAREHEMEFNVRAGGHSVAGLCLNDGGIVADIRGMDGVHVDPDRRLALVGGGATWAQVDRETQKYGLATTGGRVSSTGVGGLTLGGGSGWLERKHGFTCDNLVSAEVVTAEGEIVTASADTNPDLFWALKGGGGNFGVVTSFEFRLHRVGPEVFGGMLVHPFENGPGLMRAWRDVMVDAPEGLSLAFTYMPMPDDESLPPAIRDQYSAVVIGMFDGSMAEGERLLAPLREIDGADLDAFGPIPYVELQCLMDDATGFRNYWGAEQLPALPDAAIEKLHRRCEQRPEGIAQLFMPAWGGATARVGSEQSPLTGRDSRFIVHPLMLWEDPADDEVSIAWTRGFRDDMAEFATGGAYLNFISPEDGERTEDQYGQANHERLAGVKAHWDPENFFRASGNPVADEAVTVTGSRS